MSLGRTTQVGQLDLGRLPELWSQLREAGRQVEALPDPTSSPILTARKIDESQPAGHRGYMLANGYLQNGLEHVDGLSGLLEKVGATPRVPWTLMRSIFEAGFWATWLMEPENGLERRRRGLRLEVRGWHERRKFSEAFYRSDPSELARVSAPLHRAEQVYRSEAAELGLDWSLTRKSISLVDEIQKLSAFTNLSPDHQGPTIAVWRALSGLQHGYSYALLHASIAEQPMPAPGGHKALLSISSAQFQAIGGSAGKLLLEGFRLYIRRYCEV